ncbi:unnamed protein product, partial [marine sediment metagenome]
FPDTPPKWGIGFEVEKDTVDGYRSESNEIEHQPLFTGWETDGSCGVEGITNVYGLYEQDTLFADHVRQSYYTDEPINGSCGGHVNVSRIGGLTLDDVRPYAGLLYSMYRERLIGTYSSNNKRLRSSEAREGYAAIRSKGPELLEFRLVAKVNDASDLLWRYQFFRMFATAVERKWSYEYYLRKMRPVMVDNYTTTKITEIYSMSRKFDKWLTEGV